MKIQLKPLVVSLLISLGVGTVASILTSGSYSIYENLSKPPLSPPGFIFPVVWIILYILMGISAYLIYISDSDEKNLALKFYAVSLIVNFFWPIFFFKFGLFWLAFFWLLLLILIVAVTLILFKKINPTAARLLVPYLIWILFAAYLNLFTAILN